MSDDKFKEKMDRYARPKNLKVLVPKVNPEIWSVLDRSTRGCSPQTPQLPERVVHSNLCATFGKQFSQVTPPMKGVADSIALIQKTNHDLSMDRRGKMLNAQLNKKYKNICSNHWYDLKAACANFETSKMGMFQPVKCKQKSAVFFHKTHPLQKKKNLKNQTCFKNKVQGNLKKEMDTDIEKLLSMGWLKKQCIRVMELFPLISCIETRRFLPSHLKSEKN